MVLEHVGDVMDNAIGWLLDVTVERNAATLWIKLKQGGILRLVDKYQPSCYILPRNGSRYRTLPYLITAAQDKSRVAE